VPRTVRQGSSRCYALGNLLPGTKKADGMRTELLPKACQNAEERTEPERIDFQQHIFCPANDQQDRHLGAANPFNQTFQPSRHIRLVGFLKSLLSEV